MGGRSPGVRAGCDPRASPARACPPRPPSWGLPRRRRRRDRTGTRRGAEPERGRGPSPADASGACIEAPGVPGPSAASGNLTTDAFSCAMSVVTTVTGWWARSPFFGSDVASAPSLAVDIRNDRRATSPLGASDLHRFLSRPVHEWPGLRARPLRLVHCAFSRHVVRRLALIRRHLVNPVADETASQRRIHRAGRAEVDS